MDMEDLELLVDRNLRHLRCQRERVRRVRIKQWVRRDGDFVEVHALVKDVQPRRKRVADEVDVIAAARESDAELRGHDAGAAECRIARNSDSH